MEQSDLLRQRAKDARRDARATAARAQELRDDAAVARARSDRLWQQSQDEDERAREMFREYRRLRAQALAKAVQRWQSDEKAKA